jgi:hypothetical protein
MPDKKYALCIVSYSSVPSDHGVKREWVIRAAGSYPTLTREFERAKRMSIEEAVAMYNTLDSLERKMGIVPVE